MREFAPYLGLVFLFGVMLSLLIFLLRQYIKVLEELADTKRQLGEAQGRLTTFGSLTDIHHNAIKEQYQYRLDQADSRLDDQRVQNSRIVEENKLLLDRCLAKERISPIYQQPVHNFVPLPENFGMARSPAQRAQDRAAAEYQEFISTQQAQWQQPAPNGDSDGPTTE